MAKRILVVAGEDDLRTALCVQLMSEGYAVDSEQDGESGCEKAVREVYHLILLDVVLPEKNGLDVCRDLRQQGIDVPIMIVTARNDIYHKVLALKLGADDYLTTPYDPLELAARVEALLRRSSRNSWRLPVQLLLGGTVLDFERGSVVRDGQLIPLPPKELGLLRYLLERRGQIVTRKELLEKVWGFTFSCATRTLDVHVAELRRKIEDDPRRPRWILTVHGSGYKFAD